MIRPQQIYAYLLVLALGAVFQAPVMAKQVVGWVENVKVYNGNKQLVIKSKIDTGAKTTSINSPHYKIFKKEGKRWVRFKVISFVDREIVIEKPLARTVKIKRHFGTWQTRPVILLGLCLGNIYQETEVNLVDRSGLNYQLLVGRRFLEKGTLVDSSQTFLKEPECTPPNEP